MSPEYRNSATPEMAAITREAKTFTNCLGFEQSFWWWKTGPFQQFQRKYIKAPLDMSSFLMQTACSWVPTIQLDILVIYTLNTELSERETYMIGLIVSQWGFIEAEIFDQTISSFADEEDLPREMKSNAQFSRVLQLWLRRVAEVQDGEIKAVLTEQYKKIESLTEFRQAVVHSRWEWKPDSPDEITAVRVHKKSIKRVKFTFDDLASFATTLGEIRYSIRYPGGLQDRANEMAEFGGYISRQGWDLISGRVTLDNLTKRGENE